MARLYRKLDMKGGVVGGGESVFDEFNRPNNNSLGPNWGETEGTGPSQIRIENERIHIDTAFIGSARWTATAFGEDQYSRGRLAVNNLVLPDSQTCGLAVRITPEGGTYRCYALTRRTVGGVGNLSLVRRTDLGGQVILANIVEDFSIGIHYMITVEGQTIRGWAFLAGEWSQRLIATDGAITGGQPGWYQNGGTATYFMEWDSWAGGYTAGRFVIIGKRPPMYLAAGAKKRRELIARYVGRA